MKRILLMLCILTISGTIYSQTTYYWVGGATPTSIHTASNWNSALDGGGSPRPSTTGATDILIFDGSNIGGATPATGLVAGPVDGSMTCGQLKFINNANLQFGRTSGTGTITISGDGTSAEDFVIESGSILSIYSATGSVRLAMAASSTGRVSGNLRMITPFQARIDNTASGTAGSMRFTSGASFTTNITAASASYGFGNSSQSSPGWVVFEAGSNLYYEGGFSPHGSGNLFSAIDMKPGSTWHHRATNGTSGVGNFFNKQSYGNIVVENNATLVAAGSIYRVENLTVNAGCSFTTSGSGQTVVLGDLTVDGNLASGAIPGTNELVLAGSSQNISGAGPINVSDLIVADNSTVNLQRDIAVSSAANIYGKLNFNGNKITGAATFNAVGPAGTASATANLVAGSYVVPVLPALTSTIKAFAVTGTGIASNTSIVALSPNNDSIYLSKPVVTSGAGIALSIYRNGATLENNNANGYDPATGSVVTTGNETFDDNVNYIINAATTWPFGVTTGSSSLTLRAKFIEVNAPITVNRPFTVSDHLKVDGKITLSPSDVVHILPGAVINGAFGSSNYIAMASNASTGEVSLLQYDGLNAVATVPVGTNNYFLPVVITPSSSSDFSLSVFEGITADGAANGTPLTPSQKQNVVNAVWNINRTSGSGNADIQIGWDAALEGSTFSTLANTDIGLITNTGSAWSLPAGIADNAINSVTLTVNSFGSFAIGAVPQVQPFVFNTLPAKIYGDADFNGGATSLNTTQPITYTSDNPAVATIVAGNIHITGAGSANITASQATDGFYPAASTTQSFTVSKASLTIAADDLTKFEQQPNPALTITYTGFTYSETATVLTTQPAITTTATTGSAPGTYPITVSGATAANYDIVFVNGTLTVQAKQNQTIAFPAPATKTYGNADFSTGATSTNSTIPITYVSSNPAVATISGNTIHIAGGGTTTITASQAGNAGYFPATDVTRTLTVNKAALGVKILDTVKVEGQVNPVFSIVYTGFVGSETAATLTAPATVSTIATTTSPAGYYTLTPGGVVTDNYAVIYTAGRLTIYPASGTGQSHIHAFMPNGNTLTVRVYSTFPSLADVKLYDMNGRPLLAKNIFLPQGFQNADLDVSLIPSGIYVVTVKGSGGVDLKKTIPIIR